MADKGLEDIDAGKSRAARTSGVHILEGGGGGRSRKIWRATGGRAGEGTIINSHHKENLS